MGFQSYQAFADIYDLLMDDIDYPSWAGYIDGLLKSGAFQPQRIADVGCGTGSVAIELKKSGYDIIGVDLSQEMLGVAAEKARKAGVKIPFIQQDMCSLSLPAQDALVCACDVVNYLDAERLHAFFRAANGCLRAGGVLLFDISSSYKLKNIIGNELFYEDREDVTYFWRNSLNESVGKVDMELTFFLKYGDGYQRKDEFHTQYIHECADVLPALKDAGFDGEAYGFLTKLPPEETAQRIQFMAQKR